MNEEKTNHKCYCGEDLYVNSHESHSVKFGVFMFGKHYGIWKKARFHGQMQESIIDLNKYLVPNLSVIDCSVGMAEHHLRGPHCDPPVNKIIAGYDPWAVDREAAGLLGLNWNDIKHIAVGLVCS